MNVDGIQEALRNSGIDGWLFVDIRRRDPLAYRILRLPESLFASRRWYYFIPASGSPRKLVHRIEPATLDSLPGEAEQYAGWEEQQTKLAGLLQSAKVIAMQYSPLSRVPYVSLVDAGTVELVRAAGVQIVSSADLVQQFEATWTPQQFALHQEAGVLVDKVRREAFDLIHDKLLANIPVNEFEVQQFIVREFHDNGLFIDHGPIVAVNQNASDPHYEPTVARHSEIQAGDLVLIDLWAKKAVPEAVYYDITWTGYCGRNVPNSIANVFEAVKGARKAACAKVSAAIRQGDAICGFEVDDAARQRITAAGFGPYFIHRTGHSIGKEVHGTGANMDNLESHDERRIIANTCFSVEPGVYLPEFGIRSEVNVFITGTDAIVTGEEQESLVLI